MTDASASAEHLRGKPFDELIGELQRIVQALEAGNLPLEQAIQLYRRGLQLHAASEARLQEAELTITQLGRGMEAEQAAEAGREAEG